MYFEKICQFPYALMTMPVYLFKSPCTKDKYTASIYACSSAETQCSVLCRRKKLVNIWEDNNMQINKQGVFLYGRVLALLFLSTEKWLDKYVYKIKTIWNCSFWWWHSWVSTKANSCTGVLLISCSFYARATVAGYSENKFLEYVWLCTKTKYELDCDFYCCLPFDKRKWVSWMVNRKTNVVLNV